MCAINWALFRLFRSDARLCVGVVFLPPESAILIVKNILIAGVGGEHLLAPKFENEFIYYLSSTRQFLTTVRLRSIK
jgi:hypothetical protein